MLGVVETQAIMNNCTAALSDSPLIAPRGITSPRRFRGLLPLLVLGGACACSAGGGSADAGDGLNFGADARADAEAGGRDAAPRSDTDGSTVADAGKSSDGLFTLVAHGTSSVELGAFGLYDGAVVVVAGTVTAYPLDGGASYPIALQDSSASGVEEGSASIVLGHDFYTLGGGGDGIIGAWEYDDYATYDLAARTATSSSSPAINHRLALGAYGTLIYALGGDPGRDTLGGGQVWVLDTVARTWSAGPTLLAPRSQLGAAVSGSTLLVAGGVCGADGADPLQVPACPCTGDCLLMMASTATLDLATPGATWQAGPDLPAAVEGVRVVSASGRYYAMGGATKDTYPPDVMSVVSWAPGEAAWRVEGSLPSASLAAALSDGTRIVVVDDSGGIYTWTP
jgi:hypothetical protein